MIIKFKKNVKKKTSDMKKNYSKIKKCVISFFKEKGKAE